MNGLYTCRVSLTLCLPVAGLAVPGSLQAWQKRRGSGVEPSLWLKAKLGPWYAATAVISSVRVAPNQDVSQARSWVTNIN